MSKATTGIFGREPERQRLQALLAQMAESQGNLVLIGGEAGIGKTRLVDDLVHNAEARGALALHGAGYDRDLAPPYSIWIDLFRHYSSGSQLIQAPAAFTDPAGLDALRGSAELYGVVYDFLRELSSRQPVLIVLEDLHWTDDASLDLLRVVARQIRTLPVLIVITYRDVELAPSQPLYQRLPMLVREARPVRIPLRPLDQQAVSDFVQARYEGLPAEDVDRLAGYLERYAEGNPFFIEELLVMIEYERLLLPDGEGWQFGELTTIQVPPLIRQVVETRLERLGSQTRELLQVAAVIGVEVPLNLWQTVSGISDEALTSTIEEAFEARVLEETANPALLRFRHTLIQEVLYRTLNLLHRRSLHRNVGETLASESQVDPNTVAHHFLQAGDGRAAEWLIRAGQRAARALALGAMIANYERALPILAQDEARATEHNWLLCALGEAHRYTNAARALDYLDQALQLANQHRDHALRALAGWSHARVRGFRDENVLDDLRQAVTDYQALSGPEQQRILQTSLRYVVSAATLSQDLANYGVFTEAEQQARDFLARSSAPASRSEYLEFGNAHFGLALAYAALGKPEASREEFARSRGYYEETDNYQMSSNTYYWELSAALQTYYPDDPDERHRTQQAEVEANLRSELVQTAGSEDLASTTDTAILDGRWEECRRSASARLHIVASKAPSARKLAEIDRLQGHRDQAWAHINSVMPDGPATAPGRRFFFHRQEIQWIAAELAMDASNFEQAREWIEATERWFAWSGRVSYLAMPHLLRSRFHAEQDDDQNARDHATRALQIAGEPRQPLLLLAAHRALAGLDLKAGQHAEAAEHIREAVTIAEACAAPYEIALTLAVQAEILDQTGDGAGARAALEKARDEATRLNAQPLLERIDQITEGLGSQPAPSRPSSITISAREREVLEAASHGLTDAEIAEELFISPRTVSGHLHSVYTKLGVNSRTAAIAAARERGLL